MVLKTARLGEVMVEEENIINFNPGLLAFEGFSRFIMLDIAESPKFKWLQSIDKPEVVFLLVDPFKVKDDYYVDLKDELLDSLSISTPEDVLVYTIVNVPASGLKDATANLVGPLIINWRQKCARQIILEYGDNEIKYPILDNKPK